MHIKSLNATQVYGYLQINLHFNNDISFITGFNGSGKTTALKLLDAILTPSAKGLNVIPFETLEVKIVHNGKNYTINARKIKSQLEITIPKYSNTVAYIPLLEVDEIEFRSEEKIRGDDFFNSIILGQRDNKIINFLLEIPSPIFMGLERKSQNDEPSMLLLKRRNIYHSATPPSRVQKIMNSSLGAGLLDVQSLVESTMAKIRRNTDILYENQKSELIKSSFSYTTIDNNYMFLTGKLDKESRLLERRKEIENALESMKMLDVNLKQTLNEFFDKVEKIFVKIKNPKSKELLFDLEWLINKAQIARIDDFISIIDKSKERIDQENAPIREFVSLINSYYEESAKSIIIDPIGRIFVKNSNEKVTGIDCLSSGEKQILIIFANTILRERRGKIFIVDEPELSLHISWQERFISDIMSIRSDSQYIFATHSPEIISGYEDKCLGI